MKSSPTSVTFRSTVNSENVLNESRRSVELDSHSGEESSTSNDSEETTTRDRLCVDKRGKERPPLGFYINRTGFPIKDYVWERMWQHVQNVHPNGFGMSMKIRGNVTLPKVPVPNLPNFTYGMDVSTKLELIQKYLSELKYNHTGTQFFEIRKDRPLCGLMESAKEMIRESLPIKCLEATILALHLTNGIAGLQRFTIGFKTQTNTTWLSHVVLGLYYNGKFGALGLSRRDDLMYKALQFKTLPDLIENYKTCYNKYFHVLKRIKISYPVAHDPHSCERINWKYLTISVDKVAKEKRVAMLERYSRELKTMSLGFSNSPQFANGKEFL
ncbi:tubulinyl-Tyr carboxypeptidase 1-like [Dendronephthya gigantea]|uniref:tubulinyl-Tyr carboxypeptidase 1-like n=1 Tax=Dendronephthya gigantea TaxID=151771 RepID=UPI001068F6E8|nr:tubulinyl-Tyr carboxypeptidase 1-like [Dendronephthya gigantea]